MSGGLVLRSLMIFMAAVLVIPRVVAGQAPSAPIGAPSHAHGGHEASQAKPQPPSPPPPKQGHPTHKPGDQAPYPPGQPPPTGLPPITDEDRKAAFPELNGQHTVHDDAVFTYVLFDQLEWQAGDGGSSFSWDNKGWIGRDVNRFWFRTEGEAEDGDLGEAEAHALYGRAIARWWDLVVGVRQDVRPGPARTWAAVGIQGLAPYWFEVEATAYVGESGRTHLRLESEYELLLTNRLVLQPLVEVDIYGKSDPERGLGAGLSSMKAGLRLRYEIRRELAPYVGVTWNRKFFGTADRAKAEGEDIGGARLALGVRVWF
jgi:copper resistance protein B